MIAMCPVVPPPPLPGLRSATRCDHREDACLHSRRKARPSLDHLSESGVCGCGCGRLCGHFSEIATIPGRNRLRLRIANPPSSVRLRPEPLSRRPLRRPACTGFRRGFFVGGLLIGPLPVNRRTRPRVAVFATSSLLGVVTLIAPGSFSGRQAAARLWGPLLCSRRRPFPRP